MDRHSKKVSPLRQEKRHLHGDRKVDAEQGSWQWHEIAKHLNSTSRHPIVRLHLLAHEYHELRSERALPPGSVARKHDAHRQEVAAQFDRLLDRWVVDDALMRVWDEYFYHTGPAPVGPELPVGPMFIGRSEQGERVEVREGEDAYFQVLLEGNLVERLPNPWQPATLGATVSLVGEEFTELFDASFEARLALTDFARSGHSIAPWRYAAELYGDGLIDEDFALTQRGRRCIALIT